MKRKHLFLVGLLLAGCHQESQVDDSNTIVSPGMSIDDAVALVRREGLSVEECTPAVAHVDPKVSVAYYRIEPTHRPKDALLLATHSHVGKDDEVVDHIFWHLDYEHDSELPKSERKREYQSLSSIDLKSLKDTKAE